MASMNWLDFSLSPQELPSQPLNDEEDHSQTVTPLLGFNSHEISVTECFDLSSFALVEAPNRNNTHHITPLDYWNTKGLGTSCSSNQNMDNNQQHPKLENFLLEKPATGGGGCPKNTNSIGLSMIKTWLRKQMSSQSDAANTSLSMSTTRVSESGTVALPLLTAGEESSSSKSKQSGILNVDTVSRKSADTFGKRTSIYRGVSRHRWTGRYEAHLWDNSSRREGKTSKGKQVYLGGYDKEEKAARAYDLAALKYWGATTTTTNFPIIHYEKELEEMKNLTRQEYVASLRRKSSGFSRGASIYRGVTRHHQHGRWQARIGRVAVNKDLYLGTFNTQEEAAEAYDIAAIKFRGLKAVTNFDMNRYDVKSILESSTLPIGGAAKRLKDADEQVDLTIMDPQTPHVDSNINIFGASHHSLALHQPQPYSHLNYTYGQKFWIDSASVDNNNNSSGSNYVIYGGGDGYAIPMATPTFNIADDDDVVQNSRSNGLEHNDVKMLGYENVLSSSTDPYHARDLCYLSQPASGDTVKGSAYDACNTWVPFVIPSTLALRHTNDLCSGASPFTLLHE
ncbi:hypothetical protein GLYMA_10G171400v4 [Glycine max]|nr:hypothetical protein GLYMA_10G171400v4 [Glycine max]